MSLFAPPINKPLVQKSKPYNEFATYSKDFEVRLLQGPLKAFLLTNKETTEMWVCGKDDVVVQINTVNNIYGGASE
jgi:hypothetical protein